MTFDRAQIRAWVEEATGQGLSVDDWLPDTLAAAAEGLGLAPAELRLWIFDHATVTATTGRQTGAAVGPETWSMAALANWAKRYGFSREDGAAAGEGSL